MQCDGPCAAWFHQLCLGIKSPEEIAHLDKFYCIHCDKANVPSDVTEEAQDQLTDRIDETKKVNKDTRKHVKPIELEEDVKQESNEKVTSNEMDYKTLHEFELMK